MTSLRCGSCATRNLHRAGGSCLLVLLGASVPFARAAETPRDYSVRPVSFSDVRVEDAFWAPRQEMNRTVTLPFAFRMCEETGHMENFAIAAGRRQGEFRGKRFFDSDVYKGIEGAAYSLHLHPDPTFEKYLDDLIDTIAAAQEGDGYLYTARTANPKTPAKNTGPERWSLLKYSHELYNVGHLYEAAVAHWNATGKRRFLDVAIKNADLLCRVFGPEQRRDVPGHPEIEIGLVKLYRATGDKKYLALAEFFIEGRGRSVGGRELYGQGALDHKPIIEQDAAVGHAVMAAYLYAGTADVAALTGNAAYGEALDRLWEDVVSKKLYLTGGIGARKIGETFGDAYELPNASAHNETCAAIANAMWNHRMFLLHGDAKYLDVLERTACNGVLAGISLGGDLFFYPNPLEANGQDKFNFRNESATRAPWFNCPCCPMNLTRFLAVFPGGYAYAQRGHVLYVNLFFAGGAAVKLENNTVRLAQKTRYPWDGAVKITVDPEKTGEFEIHVRIPGWARNQPVPGDLYRYMEKSGEKPELRVNDKPVAIDLDKGFARIRRTWKAGDVIELNLPMPVRRVLANENVEADRGRVALERGPMVYCAEGVDHGGQALNLFLPDDAPLRSEFRRDLLGGVQVIAGKAMLLRPDRNAASVPEELQEFLAIPYYAWSNRGVGEMAVWLTRDHTAVHLPPTPAAPQTSTRTSKKKDKNKGKSGDPQEEEPAKGKDPARGPAQRPEQSR